MARRTERIARRVPTREMLIFRTIPRRHRRRGVAVADTCRDARHRAARPRKAIPISRRARSADSVRARPRPFGSGLGCDGAKNGHTPRVGGPSPPMSARKPVSATEASVLPTVSEVWAPGAPTSPQCEAPQAWHVAPPAGALPPVSTQPPEPAGSLGASRVTRRQRALKVGLGAGLCAGAVSAMGLQLIPESPVCGDTRFDELEAHAPRVSSAARRAELVAVLREIGLATGMLRHANTGVTQHVAGAMPVATPTPPLTVPPPSPPMPTNTLQIDGGLRAVDPSPEVPARPTTGHAPRHRR